MGASCSIGSLQEQGALDMRVNQQQIDIVKGGGVNRLDLQYTLNGGRYYEDFDTSLSGLRYAPDARSWVLEPAREMSFSEYQGFRRA
ncbi:hypothetical protein [Pengzhenrongella sp.]|jgi:hypothetical protein|uniref:hypothetical protein n=1 Tax=Pengzhenrongella sp. TaxID=2888820 RepID=UPI002F94F8E6